MPTGSPGRINEPWGPSRSADSDRTVTRVLRSTAALTIHETSSKASRRTVSAPGWSVTSRRPELDSPYLNGDPYPLGAEASEDPLAQLVLHQELVGERLHVAEQREVQRELAEAGDEPRRRFGLGHEPRHIIHGPRGLFFEDSLHQVRIDAVVDRDADRQHQPRLRHVVVRDHRLGYAFVGNGDHDVLEHAHAGRSPADVHHVALDGVGDLHVVADADRLVGEQMDAREEIRERVLQGERDRETAHAERREDGRDLDAERAQQYEEPDDEDEAANDRLTEPGDRATEGPPLARALHEGREDVGDGDRHRENHRHLEHEAYLLRDTERQPLGLAGDLGAHPEPENDGPEDRRQSDCLRESPTAVRAGPAAERGEQDRAKQQREQRGGDEGERGPRELRHWRTGYRSWRP